MRLDTANRSFVDLLAVAAAPIVLFVLLTCGPVALGDVWTTHHGHHSLPTEIVHSTAFVFAAVALVAVLRCTLSLLRQFRAGRRVAREVALHRLPPDHRLNRVAAESGVNRVVLTDATERYSFTFGLWWPWVVVSRPLLDSVSDDELRAVLAHERYHVRNHDPLKMMVGRALTPSLFLLPMTCHLFDRYLTSCELAADRSAMAHSGPAPLAGALYKMMSIPGTVASDAVAALGGTDVLDVRLVQLESGGEPPVEGISRWAIHASVVGLLLISLGLAASAVAVTGSVAIGALGWMHQGMLVGTGAWLCLGVCLTGVVVMYRWLLRRGVSGDGVSAAPRRARAIT